MNQKPSERIKEIIDNLESTRLVNKSRSSAIGELLKKRYGTANYRIVGVIQYLDEKYEEEQGKEVPECPKCHVPLDLDKENSGKYNKLWKCPECVLGLSIG